MTRTTFVPKLLSALLLAGLIMIGSNTAFAQTATATAATSHFTMQMGVGSQSSDVSRLQTWLAMDPAIYPQGLVTGYYGSLTAAAVSRFQARYGLPQVGRVGPQTLIKINILIDNGTWSGGSSTAGAAAPMIFNVNVGSSTSQTVTTPDTGTTTGSTTTQASVVVSWNTNVPTTAKVYYSPIPLVFTENSSLTGEPYVSGSVMTDTNLTSSKSVTLPNLSTGTTYYYLIEARDANGNTSVTWPTTFQTQSQ